jgi:hypothetical protein
VKKGNGSDDRADEQYEPTFILEPRLPSYGPRNAIEKEETNLVLSCSERKAAIRRSFSVFRGIAMSIEDTSTLSK